MRYGIVSLVLMGLLATAGAQEQSHPPDQESSVNQQVAGPVNAAPDEVTARTLEIFNAYASDHDASGYAPDALFYDATLPEPVAGREAIAAMLHSIYVSGFPDAQPQMRSLTAVGNRVVMEFIFNGTNTGELFGNPPTGRRISVPMIAVYQIEDDLIQEARLYYDGAGYARQLGWIE